MPVPNLIHPVNVTVEQIDKAETFYDEDAREPVQHAARKTTVTLKGQPRFAPDIKFEKETAGGDIDATGYVLFRKVDLDAENLTLAENDRIIAIGHLTVSYYINRLEWSGHYADTDGASLLKAYFIDRTPGKAV